MREAPVAPPSPPVPLQAVSTEADPGAREVPVTALDPGTLAQVIEPDRMSRLRSTLRSAARSLRGRTVWNVNSTASGGGVAETLARVLGYMRGADVDARWLTIDGDDDFFLITKRLHHRIHDSDGDGGPLTDAERRHYLSTCRANASVIRSRLRPGDVVILHDPQTAGLAPDLRGAAAATIWRSHIGSARDTPLTQQGWAFLEPDMVAADGWVFSSRRYLRPGRPSWVIPPSIDPFSPKNGWLSDTAVEAILVTAGMLAGRAASPPEFRRSDGTLGRVRRRARVVGSVPDASRDLVVQVSRWDWLKDPVGVMGGFSRAVQQGLDAHLLLVGPDPDGVADDPEGTEVLRAATRAWSVLPAPSRGRISLACLPQDDDEESAAMVNAVQRRAAVAVQKSLAEGFGLTVTEAMWKGRPVLASPAGGIADQIVDGRHGVLLRDPGDQAGLAENLHRLLTEPGWAARLGRRGRERVRTRFLDDSQLSDTARLCAGLVGSTPA